MDQGDSSKNISNSALQIALQTMKERCQQLQLRLSHLEEENLKLKLGNTMKINSNVLDSSKNSSQDLSSIISKLRQENENLIDQKSQLSHHIYMVASENKQLWTKLSLLSDNQGANGKSRGLDQGDKENNFIEINLKSPSDNQNKSEIKDLPSIRDFEFNLSMNLTEDSSNNLEVPQLVEQLNQTKTQLKTILTNCKAQQDAMKTVVLNLFKSKKEKENESNMTVPIPLCNNCEIKKRHIRDKTYKVNKTPINSSEIIDANIIDSTSLQDESEAQSICPICREVWIGTGEENMFFEHVANHFQESDDPCNVLLNLEQSAPVFNL